MDVALSPALQEAHTGILHTLKGIERVSRQLDRDIRVGGLRVDGRRSINRTNFSGWAYPEIRTRRGGLISILHPDGRIVLNIGDYCTEEDFIRVYAHELRHIGQFHRGRKVHGVMTTHPLDDWQSEQDAEAFEERVLNRI